MSGNAESVSSDTVKYGYVEAWCPLSKEPCREDCAWADVVVEMTEDGMDKSVVCAIAVIGGFLLDFDTEEIGFGG